MKYAVHDLVGTLQSFSEVFHNIFFKCYSIAAIPRLSASFSSRIVAGLWSFVDNIFLHTTP